MVVGVLAAVLAAMAWSLNFIVPFVIGNYTIFDFALFQFLVPGLLSVGYLAWRRDVVRLLNVGDWLVAFRLGLIGYLCYFLALVGAAVYAGPVIAPAFLGMVPVILAVAGNLRRRVVSWRKLALPLVLASVGLLLVNCGSFGMQGAGAPPSLFLGVMLAILAVMFWTAFGLLNETALTARPNVDAGIWSALILSGAALGMLAFYPVGSLLGAFEIPHLGLQGAAAASFMIWGAVLGILVNVGGALAWTCASQRIPVALSAQLITLEPTFGTLFGLLLRHRWPTWAEGAGMALILIGVVIAIRVFHGRRAMPGVGETVGAVG